jgi:hypothetical protein
MRGFGWLRAIHRETVKIQRAIADEFDVVEPEDRLCEGYVSRVAPHVIA